MKDNFALQSRVAFAHLLPLDLFEFNHCLANCKYPISSKESFPHECEDLRIVFAVFQNAVEKLLVDVVQSLLALLFKLVNVNGVVAFLVQTLYKIL